MARSKSKESEPDPDVRIAIIGGTGPEGMGLATRFAKAGHLIYIGSRSEERAEDAVAKVRESVPDGHVFGGLNEDGLERADFVFLTVPSDAHDDTIEQLAEAIGDKILIDVVVPMLFDREGPKAIDVEAGSAAQQARAIATDAKVVSGFHHLDASALANVDKPMQGDVIICSDHRGAKDKVMALVENIEYIRAVDGGPLANSKYIEQLTVLLIHINKIYRTHSGVRITGF
ncbi:MAG: NADPH-dependent F420 reductase [Chloroflexi bacterium]|nr:NADPH-dependent F420 reductase [Chloroflexota bacterium]